MNRRQILAALAAAPFLPAAASSTDLKDDIAILRHALTLHPGLYRYNSPAAIDAWIDRLARGFPNAGSREARYLMLSRFLATIRCGHSYCNFFNQKKAVSATLFDRPTRLPFRFRWLGGRMIVTADPAKLGLPPGTEVTRINGIAAGDMLARLLPYARADGHNDAKRVSLLEVDGGESIEYFDVFHGLVYGAGAGGHHLLAVMAPDGRRRTIEVPAIGLAARRAQSTPRDYAGDRPVWDWTMRADGVAVLTMPGWALYDSTWDWRGWLKERLDSLTGARGLIVDIRANEGGQDCGDAILTRLIDRPIDDPGAERRLRFRTTPADLDPYLDTWDQSFRKLGVDAVPSVPGFLRLVGERGDGGIAPVAPRLTLPVAALIGPANSSATFQFAQAARRSGTIRLFGQPTGGNQRGINGGCFFFVRLPASGLEFDLPLIGYFPSGHPPDAGIAPDVPVAPTVADVAAGRDPAMAAAVRWVLRG